MKGYLDSFMEQHWIVRTALIIVWLVLLLMLILCGYIIVELRTYVKSPEFQIQLELKKQQKQELLNWYLNQDELPAGEFLMEVRNRFGDKMVDDIRLEVWNHHREVIIPKYEEIIKQIPWKQ